MSVKGSTTTEINQRFTVNTINYIKKISLRAAVTFSLESLQRQCGFPSQ